MTHVVVVTANAKQNLRDAYLWAAERAPETAARWLARFEAKLEKLAYLPERFELAPRMHSLRSEIRQLIFGRRGGAYRALFTIVGEEVPHPSRSTRGAKYGAGEGFRGGVRPRAIVGRSEMDRRRLFRGLRIAVTAVIGILCLLRLMLIVTTLIAIVLGAIVFARP